MGKDGTVTVDGIPIPPAIMRLDEPNAVSRYLEELRYFEARGLAHPEEQATDVVIERHDRAHRAEP